MENKKILICINGGIACYKICDLCSKLKKKNYDINIIMSENATKFVSPLTFQSLTGNKVYTDMFSEDNLEIDHISLVKNSNLVVFAPATSNILGKCANGIADDFISTIFQVASKDKVVFFPAMNTNMYENVITQDNIKKLSSFGYKIIEPAVGRLACGDTGKGKLVDTNDMLEIIEFYMNYSEELKGKNILISAGGTREYIDSVRYISNISSGKMGYALARQATRMGANVILVTTNTQLNIPFGLKKVIRCENADELHKIMFENYANADVIIMSAAVSDFKVINGNSNLNKIKKGDINNIKFELNKDILKDLSDIKPRKFKLIGFAAETDKFEENALKKLNNKNLDFLILNDVSNKEIGFNSDYNEVIIYDSNGNKQKFEKDLKENIAKNILLKITNKL